MNECLSSGRNWIYYTKYTVALRFVFVTDRSTHGKPLLFFLVAFRRECHLSNQLLINKKSSSTKGQNMALCETTAWNSFTLHATITQFGIFLSAEWFLLCANSKRIYTWHIAMHCSPLFVTASQWKKSSELNWLKSIPTPKECTTFLTWVHDLGFWKREKCIRSSVAIDEKVLNEKKILLANEEQWESKNNIVTRLESWNAS